jgi:hypothetical protein
MVQTYKPKVDQKRRRKYTSEQLRTALESIAKQKLTFREAEEKYGIPKSTLQVMSRQNASTNVSKLSKMGRKTALSVTEERVLVDILLICCEWGYPLTLFKVRMFVQSYLNSISKKIPQFRRNCPGEEWGRSFLRRHPILSTRSAENVKHCRAAVSPDVINAYFDELEKSTEDVPPSNIINYDETAFVDDPGKCKFLFCKGKRAENVIDHSRTSSSVMFACSADGKLLPPYVVYKSKNMYDTWTMNGPEGTLYNRAVSGWFSGIIFEDWFVQIALPYFRRLPGPKVLIGDNLASHVSYTILEKCQQENIRFVFLPPNATHLCQPLDVAVFRSMKRN